MTLKLDLIKKVWKYKLTKDFHKGEIFSVYVDSPFCTPPYCNFCIYEPTLIRNRKTLEIKDRYYDEILIENIRDFSDILCLRKPDTVYFGGGTSSLMTISQMEKVFQELQKHFDFRNVKEKHFEFNPLSATDEKIKFLIEWNFSHMTFGVQTFNQGVLKFNNRVNVPLKRLKEIFSLCEKNNIKYNMDLLAFIYKGNLEEDIQIIKDDLKLIQNELKPRRITIFPNYRSLKNPVSSVENKNYTFNKIRKLREAASDFLKNSDYADASPALVKNNIPESNLYETFQLDCQMVRKDFQSKNHMKYNSTSPVHKEQVKLIQNLLGIGGYGRRKVYSYLANRKFPYYTINFKNLRLFELIQADQEFSQLAEKS